jgi:hypothetical protein
MKSRNLIFLLGVSALLGLGAWWSARPQKITQASAVVAQKQAEPPKLAAIAEPMTAPPQVKAESTSESAIQSLPLVAATESSPQLSKAQPSVALKTSKAKEPIKDPMARAALSLVGADPEAEAYWFSAINDPNLSAHERQDLIEDLNEDGLSDPKNPAAEDLPIILSRIQLIEMVGAEPMDKVNEDALKEAYKDLVEMAGKLTAQ